jgi:hypothetical protein
LTVFCCRPLLAVALLSLAAGCQRQQARTTAQGDTSTRWHALGEWSGRGNRQTESFEVTTGAMRLIWESRVGERASDAGHLRVSLHSAISGRSLQTIVDVRGAGGSTVNLEDDPRTSYLVIESENLDWRVKLEEAIVTARSKRPDG